MVAILRERLAIQNSDGRIICSMDRKLDVHLASPTRGCVPFLLELYVNLFDLHRFINDLLPSVILPPLCGQYVYFCGAFVRPRTSKSSVRVGLEPTIPRVRVSDLVFPRIERAVGSRSVDPTYCRIPGLRTPTILREWTMWLGVQSLCASSADS